MERLSEVEKVGEVGDGLERVRIRGIGSDGAGVGDLADGRVVFVPRTAPGDEVRVRITKQKRRWARGRLEEILEPAPERVDPACPYYHECGGCSVQHLAYDQQLEWKSRIVQDSLTRIGHLEGERLCSGVEASPKERYYRSRVTFTLVRLPGGRVVAGFHQLARPGHIVDVHDGCILPEEALGTAWLGLRAAWGEGARRLPAGAELRLTLRAVDEGVILIVEGGRGPGRADMLLRDVEGLIAVWSTGAGGGAPRLLAGVPRMHDTRLDEAVRTGPRAFVQVNREAAAQVHAWVLEQAGAGPGVRVVDAYCGSGLYGRRLARAGAIAVGIERDAGVARDAARDAPDGFEVVAGAVEDLLAEALPADLVILNPPRAGVAARVPEVLLDAGPPLVIYVSCDPATLARDLERLATAYEVTAVRAFDLFPQTAHVEIVAVLRRTVDPGETD